MMTDTQETVLIAGASTNPQRYSHEATKRLFADDRTQLILVGKKKGDVLGYPIQPTYPDEAVHTVTVYLGEKNQGELVEYLEKYPPQRIIFNPGAENPSLSKILSKLGVETLDACTLVMLGSQQF